MLKQKKNECCIEILNFQIVAVIKEEQVLKFVVDWFRIVIDYTRICFRQLSVNKSRVCFCCFQIVNNVSDQNNYQYSGLQWRQVSFKNNFKYINYQNMDCSNKFFCRWDTLLLDFISSQGLIFSPQILT